MNPNDKQFRKVSAGILVEDKPPQDDKRPLEWRRSFKCTTLKPRNLKTQLICGVHDTDSSLDMENVENPLSALIPKASEISSVTAVTSDKEMHDRLYVALEDKDKQQFSVERLVGNYRLTIKSGNPSESSDKLPNGIYRGDAFTNNFDPSLDETYFIEVTIPAHQLKMLIDQLERDSQATLEVSLFILGFTYEVDDAFREHYHSQDIIVLKHAPCYVAALKVSSRIGTHFVNMEGTDEIETPDLAEETTPEQRTQQELVTAVNALTTHAQSIIKALWVLIGAVITHLVFSKG